MLTPCRTTSLLIVPFGIPSQDVQLATGISSFAECFGRHCSGSLSLPHERITLVGDAHHLTRRRLPEGRADRAVGVIAPVADLAELVHPSTEEVVLADTAVPHDHLQLARELFDVDGHGPVLPGAGREEPAERRLHIHPEREERVVEDLTEDLAFPVDLHLPDEPERFILEHRQALVEAVHQVRDRDGLDERDIFLLTVLHELGLRHDDVRETEAGEVLGDLRLHGEPLLFTA